LTHFDEAPDEGHDVVECAVNLLKDFRAVITRYDKLGHNFLAVVIVATVLLWLI
jgi:transposase